MSSGFASRQRVYRVLLHHLQPDRIAGLVELRGKEPGDALGVVAQISAALRIARSARLVAIGLRCGKVPIRDDHAAEVLGPRPVLRGVDDHLPDLLRAQLYRLLRVADKGVGLALNEQIHRVAQVPASDPGDVLLRVDANVRQHGREHYVVPAPEVVDRSASSP